MQMVADGWSELKGLLIYADTFQYKYSVTQTSVSPWTPEKNDHTVCLKKSKRFVKTTLF